MFKGWTPAFFRALGAHGNHEERWTIICQLIRQLVKSVHRMSSAGPSLAQLQRGVVGGDPQLVIRYMVNDA